MTVLRTLLASVTLAASVITPAVAQTGELNVYSARHYDVDRALYDAFTQETGVPVNLLESDSDALIERLRNEDRFSPADVFITVDVGRVWRAEERDLFQPVVSETLTEAIPANLRHPDGLWYGVSKRARVIIYNAEAGRPEGLDTYADLADPRFRGQICMRSSTNVYNQSMLASIIAHHGAEFAEDWANRVVANFARPPQGGDTTQIRAVAAGECQIALVNTYYIARLRGLSDPAERAVGQAVGIIFPNQGEDETGVHVNMSAAGVLKHAPNRDNAVRFMEFLTSEPAQRLLADRSNEYPAVLAFEAAAIVASLGTFREDTLNPRELGSNQAEAVRIFDRAGWL